MKPQPVGLLAQRAVAQARLASHLVKSPGSSELNSSDAKSCNSDVSHGFAADEHKLRDVQYLLVPTPKGVDRTFTCQMISNNKCMNLPRIHQFLNCKCSPTLFSMLCHTATHLPVSCLGPRSQMANA